jgi:hypothetical protein
MCQCAEAGFSWLDLLQLIVSVVGIGLILWELHHTNRLEARRTAHELMDAGTNWELDLEIAKITDGGGGLGIEVLTAERERKPLADTLLTRVYADAQLFALIKVRLNEYEQLAIAIRKYHVDPWFAFEAHHLRIDKAWRVYEPLIAAHRTAIHDTEVWAELEGLAKSFTTVRNAAAADRRKVCRKEFPRSVSARFFGED